MLYSGNIGKKTAVHEILGFVDRTLVITEKNLYQLRGAKVIRKYPLENIRGMTRSTLVEDLSNEMVIHTTTVDLQF